MSASPSLQRALAALDDLVALPRRIQKASSCFQELPMGRGKIGVVTRAGSFLLGGSFEYDYEFDADFPDTRHALYEVRDQAEDDLEAGWSHIAAVQHWIEKTLPDLAAQLGELAALVEARDVNATARASELRGQCATSLALFEASEAGIADLCASQREYGTRLGAVHDRMAKEVQQRLSELNDFLEKQPNGQRDALSQFSQLQMQIAAAMRESMEIAARMQLDTQAAGHAVGLWAEAVKALPIAIGHLVTETSSPSPAGNSQEVEVTEVAGEWKAAAATAVERLQSESPRSPLRSPSLRARASARRD